MEHCHLEQKNNLNQTEATTPITFAHWKRIRHANRPNMQDSIYPHSSKQKSSHFSRPCESRLHPISIVKKGNRRLAGALVPNLLNTPLQLTRFPYLWHMFCAELLKNGSAKKNDIV
jgi:hypothetical protein